MYIPAEQDPIVPLCKTCSHQDLKHKSGKCKAGLITKCTCKQFIFDKETFEKEVNYLLEEMKDKLEEHKEWAIKLEKNQSGEDANN